MTGLFLKLDVEYASDDEFIEAGPLAELLFIRSLCFMKRKRLDGKLKRVQLASAAGNIPNPTRHAQSLVDVGLWEVTQDGWYCPSYLKRNPSKADIEAEAEMAREAGERGNHERWHIGVGGKPSPKCRLCRADHIAPPIGDASGTPIAPLSPEPEPEKEPETEAAAEAATPMAAAAAAAFNIWIQHRMSTARDNPIRLGHVIRTEDGPVYAARLNELAEQGWNKAQIAKAVFGLSDRQIAMVRNAS